MTKHGVISSKAELIEKVLEYNPNAKVKVIGAAYDLAEKAHSGQKRMSGKDYFEHILGVATILVELKLDSVTIAAGLLHDVVEDTKITRDEIKRQFGEEVLSLIEGVTKIEELDIESDRDARAENIRKIILGMIKDVRIILIKLADRLHNMRTLDYLTKEHQQVLARETLEIYVPIAYKLGIYRVKSELEDLCLRYLEPDIYQTLKSRVAKKRQERDEEIKRIVRAVISLLKGSGIESDVGGRAKNFYSIYKKMLKKNIPFGQVRDLYAIRILVDTVGDCYKALGVIHSAWTPIIRRFDDYIAAPKPNMYQSLHTEVLFDKKPVEIQIRTFEMHHLAEEGIAAHWRYKETDRDKKFDRRIAWMKQILDWKASSAKEFIEGLKIDVFKDEIYVFTPKGDPIALPEKATPVDFAYAVHTDIGDHCIRAKVNNSIVPLDHELESGDVCEIVTNKSAKPSRSWLGIAKAKLTRVKIRQALNITKDVVKKDEELMTEDELIKRIDSRGIKESALKVARCCTPECGDDIVGYHSKEKDVVVHKRGCQNLKALDEKRILSLMWKKKETPAKEIEIEIVDRVGLLADILKVISDCNVSIESVYSKELKDRFMIIIEAKSSENLDKAIEQIRNVKNVIDVRVK